MRKEEGEKRVRTLDLNHMTCVVRGVCGDFCAVCVAVLCVTAVFV